MSVDALSRSPAPIPRLPRPRWRAAVIILALMAIGGLILWIEPDFLRGMHSVATMILLGAGTVALLIWFFLITRFRARQRLIGIGLVLLFFLIVAAFVRLDGWDGSMRPIFAWRWTPTAEQRFASSRHETPSSPAVSS